MSVASLEGRPGDPGGGPSARLWSVFAGARDDRARLIGWLSVLVARLPDAVLGAVLAADHGDGTLRPMAVVPDPRSDLAPLQDTVAGVLQSRRPAIVPVAGDDVHVAYPVAAGGGRPRLVALIVLRGATPAAAQEAMRELHWAAGWLAADAWQAEAGLNLGRIARAEAALDILAAAGEHRSVEASAMAIVNALPQAVPCDQAGIGLVAGRRRTAGVRLVALSHSAWFKRRSRQIEALTTAMEEGVDQGAPVAFPALPGTERAISLAHADYVRQTRARHVLSVPLPTAAGASGALFLERREDQPFSEADLLMAEAIGALLGPFMEQKRLNGRWLGGRLVDGLLHALGVLLGPARLSWKLLGLGLLLLLVAAATVRAPFRIQADAVLRGSVQRAVVAPFSGYVAEAPLRAGDRVGVGAVIARLADADLQLEALRWRSERDRLSAQQRDEMAQYNRAQVALLEAQIRQADAQLALAEAKLERTVLLAPIDGLILQGDLSQRLGAPVQQGEVLFEIAPLDDYRVELMVDERDLRHVGEGAAGRLILTGQPDQGLGVRIDRITPIAEAHEGANAFRVEASLIDRAGHLRPGMEGIAKIDVGDRLLSYIWTRRLADWARRTIWVWQP